MMKKKYSHHYERYFYKFIAANECWIWSIELIRLSPDEKNYKVIGYVTGYQLPDRDHILMQSI